MRFILIVFAFIGVTRGSLIETIKELGSNASDAFCTAFANIIPEFPISEPTTDKVLFQLRTPCGVEGVPVDEANNILDMEEFNIGYKTVVFVTGFLVSPSKDYVIEMAKAYHCRGGYNYIVVETEGLLTKSVFHTDKLGESIAIGLQNLGVRAENMHLIGHSLGAQIVGSTARHYFNLTGKQIERITGLDPARPCFVGDAAYPRIGRGDAKYVDIIHSNPGDMGTEEVIGDADFYPGGLDTTKPGCSTISLTCSHERAIEYFSESIYPKNEQNFIGKLCNNFSDVEAKNCNGPTSPMGFAANANFKGIYYVDVREQSPFGSNAAANALVEFEKCGLCS